MYRSPTRGVSGIKRPRIYTPLNLTLTAEQSTANIECLHKMFDKLTASIQLFQSKYRLSKKRMCPYFHLMDNQNVLKFFVIKILDLVHSYPKKQVGHTKKQVNTNWGDSSRHRLLHSCQSIKQRTEYSINHYKILRLQRRLTAMWINVHVYVLNSQMC